VLPVDLHGMPDFNIPTDKAIAEKAAALILADLSNVYSISQLAAEVGTVPHRLRRAFKKRHGESLTVFSRKARMEKAKQLLLETNNTLQVIAETVGYSEGNNFHASFKKATGQSPGEWRKKAWEADSN
jgi:AraC-like DNA-binding protein